MKSMKKLSKSEALVVLNEVREENEEPYQHLREKAGLEHTTMWDVIMEWGDPREWK